MSDRMVDASEIRWSSDAFPPVQKLPDLPVYYGTLSQTEILDYVVSLQDDVRISKEIAALAIQELAECQKALRNARRRIRDLESR